MVAHTNQAVALMAAHQLMEDLPDGVTFAVTITDEDSWEEPSVFNIYVKTREEADAIIHRLVLVNLMDEGEKFRSFRIASLMVSIIEEDDK